MNVTFEAAFTEYLTQARQAHDQNQHHDFRRQLFLSFLQKAFRIELADIEVERWALLRFC